ncbi:putative spermidine synthase with an N-terminal membrane domain [Megalodesulfovibrio gigas DSM 1382 = ATCC 19364]|uniref:Polyamine aminopropyltransferase n=1 Tax=Megalodesulfovibrio gigas (strain ATCC 19364 / DSM 1382 / NCIMB 9332 / VKM B-1759) TaxID=1121448 RepID=T2G7Y6_MEGG1|nr:putative spermidine synthase with an N-terminal membrane domain [Megalodesulfovibrio gigas DSM 1382 = ATCC 19364]
MFRRPQLASLISPPDASRVLKWCIFATGLAGIVAEYVLSTLATYLLGNAILQWTMVMSLMLFAMGLGSRLSRHIDRSVLDAFILVECGLTVLCAGAPVLAYGLAPWTAHLDLIIYALGMGVGLLIGLEIPLATRANETYEALRANIAGVMENDYYGALLGGVLFAFLGLPFLGLAWTPMALGTVNWLVAGIFLWKFGNLLDHPGRARLAFLAAGMALVLMATHVEQVVFYGEQSRYKDPIVHAEQTQYQKIVLTQNQQHYWLFLNGQLQFSTFDEKRYHEPLVHPALLTAAAARDSLRVLILGGGDGLAVREVLRHPQVAEIVLVDLDPAMTRLAREHPVLRAVNQEALHNPRVRLEHGDAARFLKNTEALWDVILVDLPDPDSMDLMSCYDVSFYRLALARLAPQGVLTTQATSPIFSPDAFRCIVKTMRAAGLAVLPYRNQVPSLGEWGFVLAMDAAQTDEPSLKRRVLSQDYDALPTEILNRDAFISMTHLDRQMLAPDAMAGIEVNDRLKPVLHRYYSRGAWMMY